jgi:plastocyanin
MGNTATLEPATNTTPTTHAPDAGEAAFRQRSAATRSAPALGRGTLLLIAVSCAVLAVLSLLALSHGTADLPGMTAAAQSGRLAGAQPAMAGNGAAANGAGNQGAPARPASSTSAVKVSIQNYAFAPASITVAAGTTVTWTNMDSAPHTVTVSSGPEKFGSQNLQKGDSFSYKFTKPGTYSYYCAVHPDMKGSVTVTGSATTAPPSPTPAPTSTAPSSGPTPTSSMPMPGPGGNQTCEVSTALNTFFAHFNSAHLGESPGQQAQDLLNFDQYVKTHTVLVENMLAPLTTGGLADLVTGPLQTFFAHVNSGHLEESPAQQAQDILNLNQYVLTHTVLLENMIKPIEAQAC